MTKAEQPTITQADIEIADKANEYVLFNDECRHSAATVAAAMARTSLGAQDGLVEFAKHTNWELDHRNIDPTDESSERVWRVHSVNGGRNDREWTLLGYGDTPQEAIEAALSAIKGDKS